MGLLDLFKVTPKGVTQRVPLTKEEVVRSGKVYRFSKTWQCSCGAELKIRSKQGHNNGPSNFVEGARGHATLSPGQLTWDGLAEERGWMTTPVKCPACRRGLSVSAYKEARRVGKL